MVVHTAVVLVLASAGRGANLRPAVRAGGRAAVCMSAGQWLIPNARLDSPVARVLERPEWPEAWPYSARELTPFDRLPDWTFYLLPRFVHHVDDPARRALQRAYTALFATRPSTASCLDLCSSWTSHYPEDLDPARRVVVVGLNPLELRANPSQTEWLVQDLNANPTLPFADAEFDFVTLALSVDYMTKPLELVREVNRVLRPGGVAAFAFSNRCFPTKVVNLWTTSYPSDNEHVWVVGSYFHFAGRFEPPVCADVGPGRGSDPMYVVLAAKAAVA